MALQTVEVGENLFTFRAFMFDLLGMFVLVMASQLRLFTESLATNAAFKISNIVNPPEMEFEDGSFFERYVTNVTSENTGIFVSLLGV